ncbi:MAG: AAA family ATPase [Blastocatellia bacterium]|nr:AAA family ATPase [Blastocatellia bacterium]
MTSSERLGEILILSGPPGAGKSTIADALATSRHIPAVHIHSDDFWHFIKSGWIAPYLPESNAQNQVVIDAIMAAAHIYAKGGYLVVVDGIFGPWFLDRVRTATGVPLHYVVLRPDLKTALARARGRASDGLKEGGPIRGLHEQFTNLGDLESHALDTTALSIPATLNAVMELVATGSARLSSSPSNHRQPG